MWQLMKAPTEEQINKSHLTQALSNYATYNWIESQNFLTEHQPLKTINGESLVGEGDIVVSVEGGVGKVYEGTVNGEIFNDYENNIAFGKNAHAEGQETNATGPRAHAEGYLTQVFAADAHAEGRETVCLGAQSHVEGMYGISYGAVSHVEGLAARIVLGSYNVDVDNTKPILNNVDTIRTILDDYVSEYDSKEAIIDVERIKSDYFIHSSFGERNHVEGVNNVVLSNCSHVEGVSNTIGDRISAHSASYKDHCVHAEGCFNEVYAKSNYRGIHVEGNFNKVIEDTSTQLSTAAHAEGGSNTITNSSYSHVGGESCNIDNASHTFAHGYRLNCSNKLEVSFGKFNSSLLKGVPVLFSYGIGTSDTNRKNAISILNNGEVIIGDNLSISTKFEEFEQTITQLNSKIEELNNKTTEILNFISTTNNESVFVIGDTLVITNKIDASVSENNLIIIDNSFVYSDGDLSYNEQN